MAFESLNPAFFGLFHPILIHFPIVFLVVCFTFDAYFFFRPKSDFYFKFRSVLLYASLISVVFAFLSGLAAKEAYPENDALVERHQTAAIILLIVVLIHAAAWFFSSLNLRKKAGTAFFLFSLAALASVSFTAEYGAIIVHDTTLFQAKPEIKKDDGTITAAFENIDGSIESLRTFLKEKIDHKEVQAIFDRNKCASCHQKKFSSEDFSGFTKGRHPWLALDEKGSVVELEKSPFYLKVILKNTMPPKGEVREEAGLNASDRLILLEWLKNGPKFHPPENT